MPVDNDGNKKPTATPTAGTPTPTSDTEGKEKAAREDEKTLLKDINGNQVYVKDADSGEYRKAVYADYYRFDEFYIKSESAYEYKGWQTIDGNVYYYTKDGEKVTGDQVIQGVSYHFTEDGILAVDKNGVKGIDVSKWNGSIDWNAVKESGISFVIIRCGYRGSSSSYSSKRW